MSSLFRSAFLWCAKRILSALFLMGQEELGPPFQKFKSDVEAHIQQVITGNRFVFDYLNDS